MKLTPAIVQIGTLAALVVVSALLFRQCGETSRVKAEAKAADERSRLEASGVQFARGQEIAAKDARISALTAQLAAQHVDSTPVLVASGTTGPVTVGPGPLGDKPPADGSRDSAQTPSPAPGPALCLLAPGDQGEIRTSFGAVRTEAGNIAVTGRADAYALNPERHLFGGDLRLDVAVPSTPPSKPTRGWGLGVGLTLNDGFGGRLMVSPPPFLGFEVMGSVDVSRLGTVDRPMVGIFRRF